MFFRVLSHAGLQIKAGGRELLCDPWILGSCYWRSWWNYPPVPPALRQDLKPDVVYLTHLHWDHFHGPSLRLFPKSTKFVVPYCRYDRLERDLRAVGFNDVQELRHGERLELAPGFAIRSYHFGPVFTDSALVIEADGIVMLNANDAKFAGGPLEQILADYPSVDFCFRSHNSANARQCMHVIGEPDAHLDDNDHYVNVFAGFMGRVKPKYAVPFASNSCLLHRDVFAMNSLAQTPAHVKRHFEQFAARRSLSTRLQIMVPGDSWDSSGGFRVQEQDYFENREAHLRDYAASVSTKLDDYYAREGKVAISLEAVQKFVTGLHKISPWWLRRRLRGERVLIVAKNAREERGFAIDFHAGTVTQVAPEEFARYEVRAEFPALVLLQSIRMNMFSQAWISKRVHYYATRPKLGVLARFLNVLELWEAELLPAKNFFTVRTLRAWLPRWREPLLYVTVVFWRLRGMTFLDIEKKLLGADLPPESPLLSTVTPRS